MTLKVGVIGTGMIGLDHIRRLTHVVPGSIVTAVTDHDHSRAVAAAEKAPAAKAYDSTEALIASDDVDAIVVCSWGPAHEEAILPALKAGKPIFCEKPLATTAESCLRIIDAEVAVGKRLIQVGFMRRFDKAYRALKASVEGGAIGAPLIFHSKHRNASVDPKLYNKDMALNDTMVHDVDIARWLLDDEIASVRTHLVRESGRSPGLRDPIFVVMETVKGALVTVEISVNIAYGYDIRGEISGETGTAALAECNDIVVKNNGQFAGKVPVDWRERFIEAYDVEFAEWIVAASKGGAAGPSAWDGYAATMVSAAALRAVGEGVTAPVELTDKPALYR